jgi:NAD(P)-dependent dehydrogenase (short-subunit alcohol dehydrogenase family)
MGRALARRLAERGDELYLLGRDPEDLERSARDLAVHGGGREVGHGACDLSEPEGFGPALDAAAEALGGLDLVVLTAGIYADQEELEADTERARRLLVLNFANSVAFCEEARKRLLARGGGTLCVFSSVAGDRGRKPVAIYGASKAGLSAYLEALDHKFRSEGLVTICVKPGFVKTGMTAGLKPPPFAGEPGEVADIVMRAIRKQKPLVYAPGIWRWVMLAIKSLPRFAMRRIGF